MDEKIINQVTSQVYRSFPEVRGHKPEIKVQGKNYLLIYSNVVKTANGNELLRIVRVVVDETGRVKKMTTSR